MQSIDHKELLVSVIVVTYNSSLFVLDTLESIKNQTYPHLELIITDDCSTDETVRICREWIANNSHRFAKSQIITSEVNTGISNNINRGIYTAEAHWIKFTSGDDTLKPDAITHLVAFSEKHPNASMIHGRSELIDSNGTVNGVSGRLNKLIYPSFVEQLEGNCVSGPTIFYRKADLLSLGGYDDRFAVEDYYFYLKFLDSGKLMYFTNDIIAQYRRHENNFSKDRFLLVREVLRSQLEFKDRKHFFRSHYIFCRKIIAISFISDKNPWPNIKQTIRVNPYVLFFPFDPWFWYPIIKRLVKKRLHKSFGDKKYETLKSSWLFSFLVKHKSGN